MNDKTPTPRGPSAKTHGVVAGSALAATLLVVGVWIMQGGSFTPAPTTQDRAAVAAPQTPATAWPPRAMAPAQAQPGSPQAWATTTHPNPWADPRLFQQWAAMAGTYGYPMNYAQAAQAMLMNAMRAWHAQVPVTAAHTAPPSPRG